VYFNRQIEPADLNIEVRETLLGKTYLIEDPLGEDFIRAQGYVLRDVSRSRELVGGSLSLLPDQAGVSFAPSRNFGFDADVFVDVTYKGEVLSRSQFKVRALPTLINGAIKDQFGQPLANVEVSLPTLGRTTNTNGDGGFAFGYQERGDQIIEGGSHSIIINEGFANPDLGVIASNVTVQKHRQNTLATFTLQELNQDIPFVNVQSGANNILLDGDIEIDLSEARVVFPNSRTSGPVHAQFLPLEHIGVQTTNYAIPHWLFGLQPKGLVVEGNSKIKLKVPALRGNFDYIDGDSYQYVVLLGYSAAGQVVEPIGVGRLANNYVESVGSLELSSLDYLGYALALPNITVQLEQYANGAISLPQLKAAIQAQRVTAN